MQKANLDSLEIDRIFLSRAELSKPWAIDMPLMPNLLLFHLVVEGTSFIKFKSRKKIYEIPKGSLAILPHAKEHLFFDGSLKSPVEKLFSIPRQEISSHYEHLKLGGKGESCLSLCGAVKLTHPLSHLMLKDLPQIVLVKNWNEKQQSWAQQSLDLIFQEAKEQDLFSKEITMHLTEVLVFQAIRDWLQNQEQKNSFLKAMQDERIQRVMNAVQNKLGQKWSTQEMAEIAGMSRSAFTNRFIKLIQVKPSDFVRALKVDFAEKLFRQEKLSIGEVADRLSYESEAAFARAYKKVKGFSPGKLKKEI